MHGGINRQSNDNTTLTRAQVDYSPSAIAAYCGRAEGCGRNWKCVCPICNRHSLSVTYGTKVSILIRCWHCELCGINDGFTEQRKLLIDAGLLPEDLRGIKKLSSAEYAAWLKEERECAARLWQRLRPLRPDDVAAKYLRARGIELFIGHPALRTCDEWVQHSVGRFRPVLASRLWHVEYGLSAVQLTYLQFDGSDRDRELKPGKRTLGPRKGGAVWIGAPRADEEFVVAEGLETLLSAMMLLNIRCGAAVLGSDFKNLVLPKGTQRVHIAADNGDTGREAAAYTSKLWCRRGLHVRVSVPDKEGEDFNDVLLRRIKQ